MKRRIDTKSICWCEMAPIFANGEIRMSGTRAPSPSEPASCGGATWSYQPPLSSHSTTIAVLAHTGDFCTVVTRLSNHWMPFDMSPDPGCMLATGSGVIHTTEGTVPFSSVVWKSGKLKSARLAEYSVLVKYWNGFSCGT